MEKVMQSPIIEVELIGGPEDGLCLPMSVHQLRRWEQDNFGKFAISMQGHHVWQAKTKWNGVERPLKLYHMGILKPVV